MDADLRFALSLANLADSISLPRFRAVDLMVETKPDLTPVTDADRAVERALRDRIAAERAGDGVLGEEEGDTPAGENAAGVRWVIDPIDGTRNFSRGIPVWATLVALERGGEAGLGVVSAPALGRRWWATRGSGAYADGTPMRVSGIERIDEAAVSGSAALAALAWHARDFGDFWQHVLVAEGSLDVAVDPEVNAWDVAAVRVLVEEAGGRCTGLDGGPPHSSLVSTNGLLHETALSALRSEQRP